MHTQARIPMWFIWAADELFTAEARGSTSLTSSAFGMETVLDGDFEELLPSEAAAEELDGEEEYVAV